MGLQWFMLLYLHRVHIAQFAMSLQIARDGCIHLDPWDAGLL